MTTVSIVSAVLKRLQCLLDEYTDNSSVKLPEELSSATDLKQALTDAEDVLVDADKKRKSINPISEDERSLVKVLYRCEDALQEIEQKLWNTSGGSTIMSIVNRLKAPQDQLTNLKLEIKDFVRKFEKFEVTKGAESISIEDHQKTMDLPYESSPLQSIPLSEMKQNILEILTKKDEIQKADQTEKKDQTALGHPIIAIWGTYGKTILVKDLYTDSNVREIFQGFAWVRMTSHSFEMKRMLKDILKQLCPSVKEAAVQKMVDVDLAEMVYKELEAKKCLIVLDNVWDTNIWRSIRIAFPLKNKTKSKILLTTRDEKVAAESSLKGISQYKMLFLNLDERLNLLSKAAKYLDDGQEADKMKMARIIAVRCGGSELVVNAICRTLEKGSLIEWQEFVDGLLKYKHNNETENSEDYLIKVLGLIYCGLSYQLKPCFLYMGLFPEDEDIEVETLNLLWMAEGLISHHNDENPMMSTLSNLRNLAMKGLVETGQEAEAEFPHFGTYKLQSLARELCIARGNEEEYFDTIDFRHGLESSYTPRLAIHLNRYNSQAKVSKHEKGTIRSLLVFELGDGEHKSLWPLELSDLKDYKSLKILHFDGKNFFSLDHLKGVEKLQHLRYLSFLGCRLDKLPKNIGNLSSLETLDLRVEGRMMVPNILTDLKRLRHLYFPKEFVKDNERLSIDGLVMIETLENFNTRVCKSEDLSKLEKLRVFKVIANAVSKDESDGIIKCLKTNKNNLQGSFLDIRDFDCYSKERVDILKSFFSCEATQLVLQIQGHIGKFPDQGISQSCTQIKLDGSEFESDPMPILGRLPHVKNLVLKNDAFLGYAMTCSSSMFPELKILKLFNMHYLESWIVEKGSMPRLSALTIGKCSKLEKFPEELKLREELKVTVTSMPSAFLESIDMIATEEEEILRSPNNF